MIFETWAIAIALILAAGLYGWVQFKRGSKARNDRNKELAAKRARYARQAVQAEPAVDVMMTRSKPNFGKR